METIPNYTILSYPEDNMQRFNEELILHGDSRLKSHPYLALGKLIEYCSERELAVVYDLKPRDTLRNLILRDDFTWQQRMKIAIQLPAMLGFIHAKCSEKVPYVICNLDPAHILLHQEYNPVVCGLSMMSGGVLRDKNKGNTWPPSLFGSHGYIDWCRAPHAYWTEKSDVFAFGCILIGLISKYVYEIEKALDVREGDNLAFYDSFISELYTAVSRSTHPLWLREEPLMADEWIKEVYEGWMSSSHSEENFSVVHESLKRDQDFRPAFGRQITMLAMKCIAKWHDRPSTKELIMALSELEDVQHLYGPCEKEAVPLDLLN